MKASLFFAKCKLPGILAKAAVAMFFLCQVPLQAATDTARVVKYGQNDIVAVKAKLRYSTLIILPEKEEILNFTTGDKEFWIRQRGAQSLLYPSRAGRHSQQSESHHYQRSRLFVSA